MFANTTSSVQHAVYYDAPSANAGVMSVAALQVEMQALRKTAAVPLAPSPQFTFVFSAKIAGIPGKVLCDSAATYNFVSSSSVHRHGLHAQPHATDLLLADGISRMSPGMVRVKLHIQGYI